MWSFTPAFQVLIVCTLGQFARKRVEVRQLDEHAESVPAMGRVDDRRPLEGEFGLAAGDTDFGQCDEAP